ncbi:MAG: SusC/RagA family TonB-linked outer membrane protein, partial [Candidatus Nephrothrix sp. EaCA]
MEKGTFNGTATDRDGLYQLKAGKEDAVLVFSFVGYITREISAGAQSVIDVSLEPDSKKLEEVVVVGYQTQKKIDLTSAVDKLDPQTISAPTGSISNNLAGRLSGVVGVQGNG